MEKTHLALFAGLGGFITAANRAGFKTIFANDFEPSCVATLNETFPNIPISGTDISHLSIKNELCNIGSVDLLSGGFPCQSFSGAGSNLGFDDPRGQLFFEIVRICRELPEPPKVLLLENVSFLKHFDNGSRLNTILHHLRKAGYWVSNSNALVLNSKDFCGVPQNRERLYIVAYHSKYFKKNYFNLSSASPLNRQGLWSIINRSQKVDDNYYLDTENKYFHMIKNASLKNGPDRLFQIRRVEARACPENTCPTLTANMGGGGHNVPFVIDNFGIRKLTIEECLSFQGYCENEVIFPKTLSNSSKYSMIGNAIYPEVAEQIIMNIDYSLMKRQENESLVLSAE